MQSTQCSVTVVDMSSRYSVRNAIPRISNARRGRGCYDRDRETMQDAFTTLESFKQRGLVDVDIIATLACVAATGGLDANVQEARDKPFNESLSEQDRAFLESFCQSNR